MINPDCSLYIHIPFCNSKCSYCDFFSITDHSLVESVIDRTIRQIDGYIEFFGVKNIPTVYIGGGTPTSIPVGLLKKLLEHVGHLPLISGAEVTAEANPETVTPELLAMLSDSCVNRLSMGIQSFNAKTLATLGRHCTPDVNLRVLDTVSRLWHGRLSLDFISAVPYQTCDDAIADLQQGIAYSPDHISLYSLTLEDGTALARRFQPDSPLIDDEVWIKGAEYLEEHGYRRYEISNFSLPGYEAVHNSRYWKLLPYIGVGPGGVSTLHDENCTLRRISNVHDIRKYLDSPDIFCGAETESISRKDYLFEYLMMGFRTMKGISCSDFSRIFGDVPEVFIHDTWKKWQADGSTAGDSEYMCLNSRGLLFLNQFLIDVLAELDVTLSASL
ncbi:MAG: radical SAM family heme chaperone HemW [Spirochaetia bacterium]|nr:radical SAM family heme chaperone HemW [Spirochaetia bacterium]